MLVGKYNNLRYYLSMPMLNKTRTLPNGEVWKWNNTAKRWRLTNSRRGVPLDSKKFGRYAAEKEAEATR